MGRKNGKDKKFDRHSRTGKNETAKSQKNKLGDEAESQIEGAEDAEIEITENANEDEEEESKPVLRSAADFFSELQNSEFNKSKKAVSPASEIDESSIVVKVVEDFIPASVEKKVKSKTLKQKQFVPANITMSSGFERPERPERSDFKKNGSNKKFQGKPKSSKPVVNQLNDKNFPAL